MDTTTKAAQTAKNTKTASANKVNFAKLSSSEQTKKVADVLEKYKSITQVKKAKEAIISAYNLDGAQSYISILASVKNVAKRAIISDYKDARQNVFNYSTILAAAWDILKKDKNFLALCNVLQSAKTFDVALFVNSYYTYVDSGALLFRRAYVLDNGKYLGYYYEHKNLTDTAALSVLKVSLTNFANTLKKRVNNNDYNYINTYSADTLASMFVLNKLERSDKVTDVTTLRTYALKPTDAVLFSEYIKLTK